MECQHLKIEVLKEYLFLSERSKRRVEVADQAIDDDHADQLALVGERAFEDILREVSLL